MDLESALKMFVTGAKELQTSRVLNQANEAVAQVRSSEADEAQKRQQLSAIAQDMVFRMQATGAPVSQIELAAKNAGPQQFANGDQAILHGQMTNNPFYVQQGQAANTAAYKDEIDNREDQQSFTAHQNDLNRKNQLEAAGIRGAGKNAPRVRMTDTQVDKFSGYLTQEKGFDALRKMVDENPWLVGPASKWPGRGKLFDSKYASFQKLQKQLFNSYRSAVTGAGASVGEIEMLEESFPTEFQSAESYKASVDAVLAAGRNAIDARLDVLGSTGYDVTELRKTVSKGSGGKAGGVQGPPQKAGGLTFGPLMRIKQDGKPVMAHQGSDGQWYLPEEVAAYNNQK